jgi:peptide/nickel transport system permease protein
VTTRDEEDGPTFETVDWAEVESRRVPPGRDLLVAGGFLAVSALFAYDYLFGPVRGDLLNVGSPVGRVRWDPAGFDWLVLLSLCLLFAVVVVPLASDRSLARQYWRRLRRDRLALATLGFLAVVTALATVGPALFGKPSIDPAVRNNPPLFVTVDAAAVGECLGRTTGPATDPVCHGSLRAPLGTDNLGRLMSRRLMMGARVSLLMGLVASMLMVPVAAIVGTVAGYFGGRVDGLLMRYVDVQGTVPAVLVYLVLVYLFERSLFLVVLVFGLLSWGGLARTIRSAVIQRKQEPYVAAARAAGAGPLTVVRRHLLPNVSNTVVTAVTIQVPTLILAEAALAYLGIGERYSRSFGQLMAVGLDGLDFARVPWVATEAAVALALIALAFNVLGDALRDAMDPRRERE